jgi:hypothetical protein
MVAVYIILWALAVISFGYGVLARPRKIDTVSLGLMFVALVFLIQTIDTVVS